MTCHEATEIHHPPREDSDTNLLRATSFTDTKMMRTSYRASDEESLITKDEDGSCSEKSWLKEKVIGQEKEIEDLRAEMKRLQNAVASGPPLGK